MRLDYFIIVDWSAKSSPSPAKPSRDAIWIGEAKAATGRVQTRYFRTRQACSKYLHRRLLLNVKKGWKTLVGLDIVYGYPKGFAKALRLKDKPAWRANWALLHALIRDNEQNKNNRFAIGGELNRRMKAPLGPFWGVPAGQSGIFLGSKKDFSFPVQAKKATLTEKRLVESRCPGMQSAWKLAYTGSVGSQGLMGIPYLYELRFIDEVLAKHSQVWPFDTGFTSDLLKEPHDLILHAEVWPSLIDRPKRDRIPDREQVKTYVKWLLEQQTAGSLPALFTAPAGLSKKELKTCIQEEGWVLGVR